MTLATGPDRPSIIAEAAAWREEMLRTDPVYRAKFEAAQAGRRERVEPTCQRCAAAS